MISMSQIMKEYLISGNIKSARASAYLLPFCHIESAESSTTYQRAKLGDDLAFIDKIAAQNDCASTSSSHFLYQSRSVIRKEIFQSTFCIKIIVNTIWWQVSSANI